VTRTILICSNFYPPDFLGGAELIAHYQAKALQQSGSKVVVFAGEAADGKPRHSMREDVYDGIRVFRVALEPIDRSNDFVNFCHRSVEAQFETLLDLIAPDVVHMHNIIGLSVGIIHCAKRRGIRTILTLHDHWGFCFKNTLIKQHNEICQDYTRCVECMPVIREEFDKNIPIRMRNDYLMTQFSEVDSFISPSRYLAETYVRAGFDIQKMHVIWNGVDIDRFARIKKTEAPGKTRFTFIGHFGAHKGIDLLVDAAKILQNSGRISINLVGNGELSEHLYRKSDQLGLHDIVRFWGKLPNDCIDRVFEETDVLVLPSLWPENQPVSITEAMATRTPVIASAGGGVPELVQDGHTGFLFEKGSAAHLAEKMSWFIQHPAAIATYGQNGFLRMRGNSFMDQVQKIGILYE
jgi:glycosyltransferase involved in cell wall biosynthesis